MIRNFVRLVTIACALAVFASLGFAQAASTSQSTSTSMKKSSKKVSTTPKSKQVDINSATKEQLTATGLDDATAQKIIDGRPYKTKKDLVTKNILSQDQYDKVKGALVAHGGRAKKGASAKKGS